MNRSLTTMTHLVIMLITVLPLSARASEIIHSSYGLYPRTDIWQEFADIVIKNFYSNTEETDK